MWPAWIDSRQPQSSDPVSALYLSLVTVATLGYGDITPAYPALQLVIPPQALIGFVLFTAAISWILQIYPALIRRRAAALTVSLAATDATTVAREGETSIACALLEGLTDSLIAVELDLRQYGETYYFPRSRARSLSGSHAHPYPCAGTSLRTVRAERVRSAAVRLEHQTSSLAAYLDNRFLHTVGSTREICYAYAVDHRHQIAG